MKGFCLTLATFFLLAGTQAQHPVLYWYNLVTVHELDAQSAKEVITSISQTADDSLLTYNAKSGVFMLATKTPDNMDLIIGEINSRGYFVADCTGGLLHQPACIRSGYNFQLALYYLSNPELLIASTLNEVVLNEAETALLHSEYNLDPAAFPEHFRLEP